MADALIGHTGFVGSNLRATVHFDEFYNSKNIDDMRFRHFGVVVCAGAPGLKWWANQNPSEDRASIDKLWAAIDWIDAKRFVLISTVDVYPDPNGVDETFVCPLSDSPYGRNRALLEQMVIDRWKEQTTIIRLPALFGAGLKKNALFDLMTGNKLPCIKPESKFQWYPVNHLGMDIKNLTDAGVIVANVVTEPILMGTVRDLFFPGAAMGDGEGPVASYNVRSIHGYRGDAAWVLSEMGRFLASYRRMAA